MKKKIAIIILVLLMISAVYAATRSLVPRADGEGGLGTSAKNWLEAYIDTVYTDVLDTIGAADMDYGSADVLDHTFTTNDCIFIIDGGITVSTGDTITLGTTVWNSGDGIDGEVIANDTIDNDSIDWSDMTDLTTDGAISANAVQGTDISLASEAAGDVMYFNGTDWIRLAKGTTGQVLEVSADPNIPEWGTDDDSGGATAWDDITNPDADDTITLAGYEIGFTSTLDEAAHSVFKIANTDADLAAETFLFTLQYLDDGQANAVFMQCIDDSGGTPNQVFKIGADGAISTDGGITASSTITAVGSFIIGSADMAEADLEKLDGITNGTAAANKALVLGASGEIATITSATIATATITNNIKATPRHMIFNIINPLATQTEDNEICLWPVTPAALTVTKIVVTLDAAANEVAGDLKWADAFIGLAGATVINTFDTTSGVLSDDSITAGEVASGKCIYIAFDSAPNTAILQMCVDITYDYD